MSQTVSLSLWDQIELDRVNRNTKRAASAATAAAAASAYQAAMLQQTTQAINAMQKQIQINNAKLDALYSQQVIANITNAQNFVASHPMPADKTKTAIDYMFGRNGTTSNQFIAYVYMKMAAAEGSMVANYFMGDLVLSGSVYPSNKKLAIDYYSIYVNMAIQQFCTNVKDVNDEGDNFYFGKNVPQNYYVAFLFWKAVEKYNDAYTLSNLGYCYMHGEGTYKDSQIAYQYYKKSMELGSEEALFQIGNLHWYPEYKMEDEKLAIKYWVKAAYKGSKSANNKLLEVNKENKKEISDDLIGVEIAIAVSIVMIFVGLIPVIDTLRYIGETVILISLIVAVIQLLKHAKELRVLKRLRSTVTDSDGTVYTPNFKGDTVIVTCNTSNKTSTKTTSSLLSKIHAKSEPKTTTSSGPQTKQ